VKLTQLPHHGITEGGTLTGSYQYYLEVLKVLNDKFKLGGHYLRLKGCARKEEIGLRFDIPRV
jgi:hypothetical protein